MPVGIAVQHLIMVVVVVGSENVSNMTRHEDLGI